MPSQPPPSSRKSSLGGGGYATATQRRPSPSRSIQPPSPLAPKHEHTSIASKFLHIFDQKAAAFHATVTIHELTNVPQLAGEFAVEWKFRGRRPKDLEDLTHRHERDKKAAGLLDSKRRSNKGKEGQRIDGADLPSVPGLQSAHAAYSASSISLRSSSMSTTAPSPIYPSHLHRTANSSRSSSTPTSLRTFSTDAELSPISPTDSVLPKKQISDPSSLRQSYIPGALTDSPQTLPARLPTESPTQLEEENRHDYFAPEGRPASNSVPSPRHGPGIGLGAPAKAQTILPPSRHCPPADRIAARSGTNPSVSVILETAPACDRGARPRAMSRASSFGTSGSMMSFDSLSSPGSGHHHDLSETSPTSEQSGVSYTRKGITPSRTLNQHTCIWDHKVRYSLRIPLNKEVQPPSAPGLAMTRNARPPAPLLGSGPFSDSGFHLVIYQMPSSNVLSDDAASDSDPNLPSTLVGVQLAKHRAKKGDRRGSSVETHKTVFGTVDFDLAPFAGKAPSTRRFLLKGTKTNAVIKVSVAMRWIGGEENWVAPPMREGHHVDGIQNLVENVDERHKADLSKQANGLESSSSSSSLLSRTRTNGSMFSAAPTNMSTSSLVGPDPSMTYKSYEHHLRPSINRTAKNVKGDEPSSETLGVSGTRTGTARDVSPGSKGGKFKLDSHSHGHHVHHSHHMRDMSAIQHFDMHDLDPDVIIESVFNPYAANEPGPFTYVPGPRAEAVVTPDVEDGDENGDGDGDEAGEYELDTSGASVSKNRRPRGSGRWGLRGKMGLKDKDSRMAVQV